MRQRIAGPTVRYGTGGVAALVLLFTGAGVCAQSPDQDVEALRARLERLEKKNAELQQILKSLPQGGTPEAATTGGGDGSAAPSKATVEKIAGDYLKQKDADKKADDEAKKKEEAARGYEVGSDYTMKARWKPGSGVVFETPGKDFAFHLGGRAQIDWTWFQPDTGLRPRGWSDGADFRRLRLQADGTMWEVVNWQVDFEFATAASTEVKNAFIEVAKLPWVGTFRVGHFKEPLSLENYGTSGNYITFMERSTPFEAFDPAFNLGMMLYNTAWCDTVAWATGLCRSNSFNNDGLAEDAGDGEYAYDARVTFNPWYENEGRCTFMVGGAYSYRSTINALTGDARNPTGDDVRFRTRLPVRDRAVPFFGAERVVDTGVLLMDDHQIMNLEAALVLGSFSLQGEYYGVQTQNVRRGTALVNPAFEGFYVQASYFLTGEYRPYNRKIGGFGGPAVLEPFYFVEGGDWGNLRSILGRGAWEVAVRYEYVDVGGPALDRVDGKGGEAVATRGRGQDITVGLNWYLNANTIFRVNYVWAHVEGTGASPVTQSGDMHALGTRFQINF